MGRLDRRLGEPFPPKPTDGHSETTELHDYVGTLGDVMNGAGGSIRAEPSHSECFDEKVRSKSWSRNPHPNPTPNRMPTMSGGK